MTIQRKGVGVVIGRFQVHELHKGHLLLLNEAAKHGKMLVCIGVSPTLVTRDNPLDFSSREQMVKQAFPQAQVVALKDQPTDLGWSRKLDGTIADLFPTDEATLYAGRDSFRSRYAGRHSVSEVDEVPVLSGTQIREAVGGTITNARDWRAGAIYASFNQWPRINPCVDIAITRERPEGDLQVLLGQRDIEFGMYRFPGGHIDIADSCAEDAAKREALEETGLEVADLQYVCQRKVPSWRDSPHNATYTTLYHARYVYGAAQGLDDLDRVHWVDLDAFAKLGSRLVLDHRELAQDLLRFLVGTAHTIPPP